MCTLLMQHTCKSAPDDDQHDVTETLGSAHRVVDTCSSINFATLLQTVPQLLQACVGDDIAALKTLRLVGKPFYDIALPALKSYTLTLKGAPQDTNVLSAKLLRRTRLEALTVSLDLSGNYSPTLLLEAFVKDVGPALSSIVCLTMHLQNTSGNATTALVLGKALAFLVDACPSLTSLTTEGCVCPTYFKMAGHVCPLVSSFIRQGKLPKSLPDMQQPDEPLPSLLANLTNLSILGDIPLTNLPNMSPSQSILHLDLGYFEFNYGVDWCCMPPQLRYLKCGVVNVGPPTMSNGRSLLPDLETLDVFCICLPLDAVAQLTRSSPFLKTFRTWSAYSDDDFYIYVGFDLSTAHNLQLLAASKLAFLQDAFYVFNCNQYNIDMSEVRPFLESFPLMTGIKRCEVQECHTVDLSSFLSIFPNLMALTLSYMDEMDDVELQVVASCSKLVQLELKCCLTVSSMGVLALCHDLPGLGMITSTHCMQLTEWTLYMSQQLLGRQLEFVVNMEDI